MGLGLQPAIGRATFRLNSLAARLIPQRRHLVVLTYHRVGNREQLFPDPMELAECTLEDFEAEMAWVHRHCTLVDLQTAQAIVTGDLPIPNRAALVTFDDGYREDLLRVRPCLERLGIRPTVFLATDYIGSRRRFWWDRVGACLQLTRPRRATLELPSGETLELALATPEERDAATMQLLPHAKALPAEARDGFIARIEERLEVEDTREAERPQVLSWDEVKELRSTFDFGAHTQSHPVLSTLPAGEARREMARSKEIIEAHLSEPCPTFAIPYGGAQDYTEETLQLAAEIGFTMVFSLEESLRRPSWRGGTALVDRIALNARAGLPGMALKLTWPRVFIPNWTERVRHLLGF